MKCMIKAQKPKNKMQRGGRNNKTSAWILEYYRKRKFFAVVEQT